MQDEQRQEGGVAAVTARRNSGEAKTTEKLGTTCRLLARIEDSSERVMYGIEGGIESFGGVRDGLLGCCLAAASDLKEAAWSEEDNDAVAPLPFLCKDAAER